MSNQGYIFLYDLWNFSVYVFLEMMNFSENRDIFRTCDKKYGNSTEFKPNLENYSICFLHAFLKIFTPAKRFLYEFYWQVVLSEYDIQLQVRINTIIWRYFGGSWWYKYCTKWCHYTEKRRVRWYLYTVEKATYF